MGIVWEGIKCLAQTHTVAAKRGSRRVSLYANYNFIFILTENIKLWFTQEG